MAGAGDFLGGPGARAGPPPDAVAALAQRLAGIAADIEGLRLQLGQLVSVDWKSPAAAAFRDALTERNMAILAVVRAIENAADETRSYGLFLSTSAQSCLRPGLDGPQTGGIVWVPPR